MKSLKYFRAILALLMVFGLLCGCGTDNVDIDVSSSSYQELLEETEKHSSIADKNDELSESHKESTSDSTTQQQTTQRKTESIGAGAASPVSPEKLPSYSGKPYAVINKNIPNFSVAELTTKAYEKYSPLDSLGRCGVAIASCGKEIMPAKGEERGSISSIKPSGWKQAKYSGVSGGYLWNRCHLIGWQLSAENANRKNLITGTRYMNVEGMLTFENMIADYINETGNHVAFRVTPIYKGNNLVCSGVQMEAYSIEDNGEGICFNVFCFNVQPNIKINYADGSSSGPAESTTTKKQTTTTKKITTTTKKKTTTEAKQTNPQGGHVWISKTGSKYHSNSSCSNMKNPSKVTISEAKASGYDACKKCY